MGRKIISPRTCRSCIMLYVHRFWTVYAVTSPRELYDHIVDNGLSGKLSALRASAKTPAPERKESKAGVMPGGARGDSLECTGVSMLHCSQGRQGSAAQRRQVPRALVVCLVNTRSLNASGWLSRARLVSGHQNCSSCSPGRHPKRVSRTRSWRG